VTMRALRLLSGLVVGLGVLSGCQSADTVDGGTELTGPAVELNYADVAKLYNVRVEGMDRIWARTRLRVEFTDPDGERVDESAEGHLQIIRPRKLALTVTKVGETLYYLGSNDRLFWWLDIRKQKSGLVGKHAETSVESVGAMGVPVLPLDMMELLAVLPLDPDAPGRARAVGGRFEVTFPARGKSLAGVGEPEDGGATVRLLMDRKTLEPQLVEVRGGDGSIAVRAELSRYQPVQGVPGGAIKPRLATMFELFVPKNETRFTIKLLDTQNRGDRMNAAAFDLEALVKAYGIEKLKVIEPKAAEKSEAPTGKAAPKPTAPPAAKSNSATPPAALAPAPAPAAPKAPAADRKPAGNPR
jgi:hypothetical protein